MTTVVGVERPAGVSRTSVRLPGAASRATLTVTSHQATFWDSSAFFALATLATVTPAAGETSAPWNISRLGIAMWTTLLWPRTSWLGKANSMAGTCCASAARAHGPRTARRENPMTSERGGPEYIVAAG